MNVQDLGLQGTAFWFQLEVECVAVLTCCALLCTLCCGWVVVVWWTSDRGTLFLWVVQSVPKQETTNSSCVTNLPVGWLVFDGCQRTTV